MMLRTGSAFETVCLEGSKVEKNWIVKVIVLVFEVTFSYKKL